MLFRLKILKRNAYYAEIVETFFFSFEKTQLDRKCIFKR